MLHQKDYHFLTSPSMDSYKTPLHDVSVAINKIRNGRILEAVDEEMNSDNNVLLVFGGSHITSLKPAFDQLYRK